VCANTVFQFNGRSGSVMLTQADLTNAGGALAAAVPDFAFLDKAMRKLAKHLMKWAYCTLAPAAGTDPPADPFERQMWVKQPGNVLFVFIGGQWVQVAGGTPAAEINWGDGTPTPTWGDGSAQPTWGGE
jgi:hypothetical protein